MRRSAAHAGGHTLYGGILLQQGGHFLQVLLYAVGAALGGKEVLHNELFVVEVREEEVLYPCHAEDTYRQHRHSHSQRCGPMGYQHGHGTAHQAVYGGVHHLSLLLGLHPGGQPRLGAHRHLNQRQHPAGQQTDAKHQEQVTRIFARRAWAEVDT